MPDLVKIPVFSLCCTLLALTSLPLQADLEDANTAYERGDYRTALSEYTKLAKAGDSTAQYNLAFMYYGGEGVPQDYTKAFYWFELAAKSGYARAQDTLGYIYSHGYGVKADRVRAYVWYSLAAANGVFLASQVRDTLAGKMGKAEKAQAEILTREYAKLYLRSGDPGD